MRCIFCKADSTSSTSTEHIVPESLGNIEHTLPPGVVCDKCNNYLGREVEKPVLESEYFVQARFGNAVPSKSGTIPHITAVHLESATEVRISHQGDSGSIYPAHEKNAPRFVRALLQANKGTLVLPVTRPQHVDNYDMSRFLGKIAIEALANTLLGVPGALAEVVDKEELDPLRHYVRHGSTTTVWTFHGRRIYPEGSVFEDPPYASYEVLHEYMHFYPSYPQLTELYFVLAIFGMEYAINMDAPDTSSYIEWLRRNAERSPLYMD